MSQSTTAIRLDLEVPHMAPAALVKTLVDAQTFREVLGAVCSPVTVVTSMDGSQPVGTTVSAFCSLSLDPPLVMVALDRRSGLLPVITASRLFGINVLEQDQQAAAMAFARKGADRFVGIAWQMDHGAPRLTASGAWLACELHEMLEGGDHLIVVGRVIAAEQAAQAPLLYRQRRFGTMRCEPLATA